MTRHIATVHHRILAMGPDGQGFSVEPGDYPVHEFLNAAVILVAAGHLRVAVEAEHPHISYREDEDR